SQLDPISLLLLCTHDLALFSLPHPSSPHPYTLSLHDALPISPTIGRAGNETRSFIRISPSRTSNRRVSGECTRSISWPKPGISVDRKSTRLNSSHLGISYAVFCLKKKNKRKHIEILKNNMQSH